MKNQIKYILILSAAAFLSGCFSDRNNEVPQNGDHVEVELAAGFEDEVEVATRALSADHENHVENIDVLVFEFDNSMTGKGKFLYATHGYDIKNTAGSRAKTFKAMLATRIDNGGTEISLIGKQVTLVVLANARDVWNSASVSYEEDIRDVITKLIYNAPGEWDASATSTQYFPMSSKTSTIVTMSESVRGSDFGTFDLIRAVTAIDVGFNYDAGGTPLGFDNFKLEKVALRQFPDRGYVSGVYGVHGTFLHREPASRVLVDRAYELAAPSRYGMFNEMYIPLAMTTFPGNVQNGYLLIGGYYSEEGEENTEDLTWYRMDIPRVLNESGYEVGLRTERNHRYTFKIESIDGPGYDSPEKAEAGGPNIWANMTVVPWSESIHNSETDGPYSFNISQKEFHFDNESRWDDSYGDNILTLYTDYSGGWKVDEVTYEVDPGAGSNYWLSTDIVEGPAFESKELLVFVRSNYGGAGRVAYIHLSAGRWKYTVKVQQGEMLNLSVIPDSRTISFWSHRNGAMDHNTFAVESNNDWSIFSVTYPGGTNWGLTVHKTADGKGFYVQCDRNSTTALRKAVVYIASGAGVVSVPITQDWADCGIGGNTVPHLLYGNKYVETHMLGGNPRGIEKLVSAKNKGRPWEEWTQEEKDSFEYDTRLYPKGEVYSCWMVENSDAGTITEEFYDDDTNKRGPYYGVYDMASACPVGWRLPTFEDLMGIIQLYGVAILGDSFYSADEILAWEAWVRNGDAFTGGYYNEDYYIGGPMRWADWGTLGYCYSDFDGMVDGEQIAPPMVAVTVGIDSYSAVGYGALIHSSLDNRSMLPVRCILDKQYHYE